jgi:hypothetical protein
VLTFLITGIRLQQKLLNTVPKIVNIVLAPIELLGSSLSHFHLLIRLYATFLQSCIGIYQFDVILKAG